MIVVVAAGVLLGTGLMWWQHEGSGVAMADPPYPPIDDVQRDAVLGLREHIDLTLNLSATQAEANAQFGQDLASQ